MFQRPLPYVSIAIVAYDETKQFPIMWRTEKVRSAKLQWSLPTGLHEAGRSFGEQACIELDEELGLVGVPGSFQTLGVYENIIAADNYHWVIVLGLIKVSPLRGLINKEPDKHGTIALMNPFDENIDEQLRTAQMNYNMTVNLLKAVPEIRRRISE